MSWWCLENLLKRSWNRLKNVLKTSWQRLEDVWRCFYQTSWRSLENILKISWRRMTNTTILVLVKMSWRHLQDFFWRCTNKTNIFVLKTLWRDLEDVLKASWRSVAKTIIFVLIKMSWRRLEDVSWRRRRKTSSRRLQDILIKTNIFILSFSLIIISINWSFKSVAKKFWQFLLFLADKVTTGTYDFASLIVKVIFLESAFSLSAPGTGKTQYFVYLIFNSTSQLINGISKDL